MKDLKPWHAYTISTVILAIFILIGYIGDQKSDISIGKFDPRLDVRFLGK